MSTGFRQLAIRQVHRVAINSAATAITLKAKVEGKTLSLIWLAISVSGAGNIQLLSDATEIGNFQFAAAGDKLILPHNSDGWADAEVFEDLKLGNASALTVLGVAGYVEV